MDAFESYDVDSLVGLLREDVRYSMPPYELWLNQPVEVGKWLRGPGKECDGSRLLRIRANGCPAFASYRSDPDGGHQPFAIQVLELSGGKISPSATSSIPECSRSSGCRPISRPER